MRNRVLNHFGRFGSVFGAFLENFSQKSHGELSTVLRKEERKKESKKVRGEKKKDEAFVEKDQ